MSGTRILSTGVAHLIDNVVTAADARPGLHTEFFFVFAQLQVSRHVSTAPDNRQKKLEVAQKKNSVCNPGLVQLFPHWGLSSVCSWEQPITADAFARKMKE